MISLLSGSIISINEDNALTINVGGVGYEVYPSAKLLSRLHVNQEAIIHIYTNVREDALELYGFDNLFEKEMFKIITSVSGIGPKTGIGILSKMDAAQLCEAILHEDKAKLTATPGVGKKTAERLVLELKDKIEKLSSGKFAAHLKQDFRKTTPAQGASLMSNSMKQAVEALISLGYREVEAAQVIRQISIDLEKTNNESEPKVEQLVRLSLQRMAKV